MDKEKVITIAIGLAVGITLAGLYFVTIKFLPNQNAPASPAPQATTSPAPIQLTTQLTVETPADETTTKDNPLNVSGKTKPGAKIVIFANADEKIVSADSSGRFSASVKLEEGENTLSFTFISENGQTETVQRNVILEIKP